MSEPAGLLAEVLERVVRASGDADGQAMAEASKEFDRARGPIFEDEELWETRTRAFLEWYVIENVVGGTTPIARAVSVETDERTRRAMLAWQRSYRCLAEIAELGEGAVLVIDMIGGAHIPVTERRGLPGVAAGDIAECRVVAFEDDVHFGGWFLWHPEGTRGPLLEHVRAMSGEHKSREETLDFAASLRVRSLRYSHVPAARVYAGAGSGQIAARAPR